MTNTHSPAPWTWKYHIGTDSYPELQDANSDCIMHFGGGDFTDGSGDSGMLPPNPLDAALICAAPELLKACKMAVKWLEAGEESGMDCTQPAMALLTKAITKATTPLT